MRHEVYDSAKVDISFREYAGIMQGDSVVAVHFWEIASPHPQAIINSWHLGGPFSSVDRRASDADRSYASTPVLTLIQQR